jgi:hypothetical protein
MSKKTILIIFFAALLLASLVTADADLNDDGVIDLSDLIIVTSDFSKTAGFNPKSDTNTDGIVDIYDVVFVASRFT